MYLGSCVILFCRSDFALRQIPFVAGIPQHLQEITVIEPEKVNTMLLDLYFHKVLIDHENSGVDNLYHMSFSEFVILHRFPLPTDWVSYLSSRREWLINGPDRIALVELCKSVR